MIGSMRPPMTGGRPVGPFFFFFLLSSGGGFFQRFFGGFLGGFLTDPVPPGLFRSSLLTIPGLSAGGFLRPPGRTAGLSGRLPDGGRFDPPGLTGSFLPPTDEGGSFLGGLEGAGSLLPPDDGGAGRDTWSRPLSGIFCALPSRLPDPRLSRARASPGDMAVMIKTVSVRMKRAGERTPKGNRIRFM